MYLTLCPERVRAIGNDLSRQLDENDNCNEKVTVIPGITSIAETLRNLN